MITCSVCPTYRLLFVLSCWNIFWRSGKSQVLFRYYSRTVNGMIISFGRPIRCCKVHLQDAVPVPACCFGNSCTHKCLSRLTDHMPSWHFQSDWLFCFNTEDFGLWYIWETSQHVTSVTPTKFGIVYSFVLFAFGCFKKLRELSMVVPMWLNVANRTDDISHNLFISHSFTSWGSLTDTAMVLH
jgi:hypothetical protein